MADTSTRRFPEQPSALASILCFHLSGLFFSENREEKSSYGILQVDAIWQYAPYIFIKCIALSNPLSLYKSRKILECVSIV